MRRGTSAALVLAGTFTLPGCMSTVHRQLSPDGLTEPYEATGELIGMVVPPDLMTPLFLIDLPLSFVADTILLPWDLGRDDPEDRSRGPRTPDDEPVPPDDRRTTELGGS